jgi:type VI secretion system VasD/TssJ family lipoprotein
MERLDSGEAKFSGRSVPALLAVLALLVACGASGPAGPTLMSADPGQVLWPRAEKAVRLRFRADRDLNVYEGRAHSLQVCVYQMDKPDAFLALAKTGEGLMTLLQAEAFDQSVKSVDRLFIQPFETAAVELDRAEKATFVGLVCGYFAADPEKSARVWEIKPHTEKTGLLFKSKVIYSAGTLDLALRLTAEAMLEEGAIVKEGGPDEARQSGPDQKQDKTGHRWIKLETQ